MALAMENALRLAHAAEPDGGGLFSGPRRPLTIGLVLVVTLVAFEALAVATVMPSAQRDLGGLRLYGWAFSAFLLASLIGIRVRRRRAERATLPAPEPRTLLSAPSGATVPGGRTRRKTRNRGRSGGSCSGIRRAGSPW